MSDITPPLLSEMPDPGSDQSRGGPLVAAYIVGCVISVIFMALRLWARIILHSIGIDDYFMFVATLSYIPLTVLITLYCASGGTRHLYYISQDVETTVYVTKLNWISQTFGIISLSTGKISIALLIVRLVDRTSKWRKWLLYSTSLLMGITGICMIVMNYMQCKKVAAIWDPYVRATTTCWTPEIQSEFAIYGASLNTAMDFFLALLPMPMVWHLKMHLMTKIGLFVVLGCGVVTGVVSALKTSHLGSLSDRADITWETYILFMWTSVEITLIIALGSLPPLRGLFHKLFKLRKTASGASYGMKSVRTQRGIRIDDSEIE